MLLSRCVYCDEWLTGANKTKEHLIPKSIGGRCVIYTCEECNTSRADSLEDPRFLKFIRSDPVLFMNHIANADLSDENREKLLSLIGMDDSALAKLNYIDLSKPCENTKVCPVDDDRVRELLQQYTALEFSRRGQPLEGGRAARALFRNQRKVERRQRRRTLRDEVRQVQKAKEYLILHY